jgi:hypothetical protein
MTITLPPLSAIILRPEAGTVPAGTSVNDAWTETPITELPAPSISNKKRKKKGA